VITPERTIYCPGGGTFYGRFFACHLVGGHGNVNMRAAIERSCNTYFYTVGNMLGVDRMHKWSEKLGLALKSGIDLPNEVESIVPSTEWKLKRTGERWYPGETISVAIGQGQLSVTPMSMAVMMATVANGGTRVVPRLVKAVDEGDGWKPMEQPPSPFAPFVLKPETVAAVRDGLWLAVNGAGTAIRGRVVGRDVAGKTGTAQVISNQGKERARGSKVDLRDHGWFVFMTPKDNAELAGVVFVEHGVHGYCGATIAKHIIQTYYAQRDGLPPPAMPLSTAPCQPGASAPATPAVVAAETPATQEGR